MTAGTYRRRPGTTGHLMPVTHRSQAERLSLAPLLDLAGGVAELATITGVNRRQVYRWHHTGLTVAQADVAAGCLGLHPGEVWGDAWWSPSTDDDPPPPGADAPTTIGAAA